MEMDGKWWTGLDSNQRTLARADLQSAAFNHSATCPLGLPTVLKCGAARRGRSPRGAPLAKQRLPVNGRAGRSRDHSKIWRSTMAKRGRKRALRGRAGRMQGGRGSGRASTGQVRLWGRHAVEAALKNPAAQPSQVVGHARGDRVARRRIAARFPGRIRRRSRSRPTGIAGCAASGPGARMRAARRPVPRRGSGCATRRAAASCSTR